MGLGWSNMVKGIAANKADPNRALGSWSGTGGNFRNFKWNPGTPPKTSQPVTPVSNAPSAAPAQKAQQASGVGGGKTKPGLKGGGAQASSGGISGSLMPNQNPKTLLG